jgi:hypothetical protein
MFSAEVATWTRFWTGYLIGTLYGFAAGRTYELSDRSKWKQGDVTDEPACNEGPSARLLTKRGTGVIYLAVKDAATMVRVVLVGSPVKPRKSGL